MEQVQDWFAPLLWIIGTLTAVIAFIRLCKPVWRVFTLPKDINEQMSILDKKLENKFADIERQFKLMDSKLEHQKNDLNSLTEQNKKEDGITLSLLHDSIVQIYQSAKQINFVSEMNYYRACELYKQDGNSEYIDKIMEELTELHKNSVTIPPLN